jgi:hypothetical protein
MRRPLSIVLSIFLLFSSGLKGQDVSVTASFDTSRIFIGDQINFMITVEQPADLELQLPFFKDTLNSHIEILSGPVLDTTSISDSRIRILEKYLVTSFDSGFYRIDPVFAEKSDVGGIKRFYSDYSMLEVIRVNITPPDSTSKIFDIVAPYRAPVTVGEILPWLLIALIVSAAVWLLIRFIRKFRRKDKEVIIPVKKELAHVIAFRELERLRNEKLWQSGETKKYYSRLTEIVRQYLENRFQIFSLEMTTSETLEALLRGGFSKDESYYKLRSVLTGADLVKFAKYKPEPDENEIAYTNSWDFVTSTKQNEIVDEKNGTKEIGGPTV